MVRTTQNQQSSVNIKTTEIAPRANYSFAPSRAVTFLPEAVRPIVSTIFRSAESRREEQSEHLASERLQHNFGKVRVHPDPPTQPAPMIGAPVSAYSRLLLPAGTEHTSVPYRRQMEESFGADFSSVDAVRGQSALLAPLGARAAASRETVVFASSNPAPSIVAHELAHVVQYRNAPTISAVRPALAMHDDPAEVEARRAAAQIDAGGPIRPRAHPTADLMLQTDEEDLDSEEYLQERPPQFKDQVVGSWGISFPATLVARERLNVSFPEANRQEALIDAMFRREPLVIMHEYHRLWLYRLEWEGLSARYSRFTSAETIFHEGSGEKTDYSVSNVTGRPEVEAFVTEDGGILSPPGAGTLFYHTGGAFEDPLISSFENANAFIQGLEKGLSNADFAGLATQLERMAALNAVFPIPFAAGAVYGIASQVADLVQWLNPQQWKAIEAAARQMVLLLSDPDGEEVAATLGEEIGRTQAAALGKLLQESLIVFAYEVGKIAGPTIIEMVLGFIGIEVGPVAIVQKTLDLVEEAPRLANVLRAAKNVFHEIPERPGFASRAGETVTEELPSTKALPDIHDAIPQTGARRTLPGLSSEEQKLLTATGDADQYPGALPKDLADRELDIVKRAEKHPIKEGSDGYINEVDLGNGHKWKQKLDGTWCRFSNGPTNCTRLILTIGAQPPGTVVATALRKSALRDVYFEWAADRAKDNVEIALALDPETKTYAVVVGDVGHVRYSDEGKRWITIAHTHPGGPSQPGVVNPSPQDLDVILRGALARNTTRVRKWVHSQTPEGEWREVEYGLDLEAWKYYVQPTGGDAIYFDELSDPKLQQKLLERGLTLSAFYDLDEELRIKHTGELSATEFYASWWAQQFVWND